MDAVRISKRWVVLALLLAAGPAAAQPKRSPEPPDSLRPVLPVVGLLSPMAPRLVPPSPPSLTDRLNLAIPKQRSRAGHALVGGLIGGAAGILVCTGISNLVKDEGTGFSTCTTHGNVMFGLGGFAVGALIGSLFK